MKNFYQSLKTKELERSVPQRGFTLFYALLTISLLLAIGLAIFNITYKELILSSGGRESVVAFYSADSGMECALFWDFKYTGISSPAFGFYGDSLASGVAGYWRFEEGDGDITRDWSGRDNDGELTNMDEGAVWVEGDITPGALDFDGTDDVVVTDTAPVTGGGDRTVVMWVYPYETLAAGSDVLVDWGSEAPSAGRRYTVRLDSSNRLAISIGDSEYVSNLSVPSRQWNMVAVVLDGSSIGDHTLYVNDSGATNVTGSGSIDTGSDNGVHIGNTFSGDVTDVGFYGMIDDVGIYNRALSQKEIDAIWEQEPNLIFTDPIPENTPGVLCGETVITDPTISNWLVSTSSDTAVTTFDIELPSNRCASIEVTKSTSTTNIISRGYNTCDLSNKRRVERAIKATY